MESSSKDIDEHYNETRYVDIYFFKFFEGNCLRLEGTGDLNHYSCTEFDTGCPDEPYTDEEIYKCTRLKYFLHL